MATPTIVSANPGNLVVPLSAIIDQLQGKLSAAELNALLLAVVAPRRNEVRPGDLITADLINQVLNDLADLQARVAQLEGSTGGPVVLGRIPTGDVAVLSLLTVLGTGFDPDPQRNTVLLDGVVRVNAFMTGSDQSQLAFQVPDLFAGLPRLVELSVTTGGRTSNSLKVRLTPKVDTQGGQVAIIPQTAALPQIVVGGTYNLQWLVDSQTALPATYRFQLVFTNLSGATADDWRNGATLNPSSEQQIVRGHPLTVSAAVKVPNGAVSAQVALQVQSTDGQLTRTSDPIGFDVGATPQVSDPRAIVSLKSIGPFDASGNPNPLRSAKINTTGGQLDGLQLKFGQSGDVPLDLFVTGQTSAAGNYAYSVEVENAGTAWQVTSITPAAGDAGVAPGSHRPIVVTLRNTDTTNSTAVKFLVVRAQHTPTGSTTADFVSFIRLPIQGFLA